MITRRAPFRPINWDSLINQNRMWLGSTSRSCAFTFFTAAREEIVKDHDRFEYTSGRWIYNEHRRLAERRLVFNIDELKKAAAKSVGKTTSDIESFHKIGEGGFNRVIEISMKDGSSVIARLPYSSTLPRRLAVTSEVATLAFVRAQGIPTPQVLGYSVNDNPVGAEYILMEKLPGRPIGDAWFDLSEQQRHKVILQIVRLEKKLFTIKLPASGSIYYTRDLSPGIPRIDLAGPDSGLCIGPYAALHWWVGQRGNLDIDRGPHTDPCLALQAPAKKELAWINTYGKPRFPFDRAYRETFDYKKQNPEIHAKSLEDYLRLTPYLVPTSSKLNDPVLRHPDLQPNNIFVSDDLTVTGLIDWQHALVLPTFLAAGVPNAFQNYGDEDSMSFVPPRLQDGLDSMNEADRARALEQFRRRHVHFFYLGFTQRENEPHWFAIEQDPQLLIRRIFSDAGSPWEGLNTPLQMDCVQILRNWRKIAHPNLDGTLPECPIVVQESEVQKIIALSEALNDVDSELERINRLLGIASDGWTSNELFDKAKERAKLIKQEGLAVVSDDPWLKEMSEIHWPFDDYDEDE